MKISVIVPVFNEYEQLPVLISSLTQLCTSVHELIIVDGGSTDGTQAKLTEAGFKPLVSAYGRAKQMNFGAMAATGDLLWFIHADTQFVASIDNYVNVLGNAKKSWGRFNIILSGENNIYRWVEWFINMRSALTGIATGDQGIFIQRKLFYSIGQYDDIPIMEDVNFCKKLKKVLPPEIVTRPLLMTSSRRWEECGVFSTIILMWKMRLLYFLGVSAEKLVRMYSRQNNQ